MAKGGFRNGSGRPLGARSAKSVKPTASDAARVGMTPLAYLLSVLNDPAADPIRRDRAAIAAAAFCHEKPQALGKKASAEELARTIAVGTPWEPLLPMFEEPPARPEADGDKWSDLLDRDKPKN